MICGIRPLTDSVDDEPPDPERVSAVAAGACRVRRPAALPAQRKQLPDLYHLTFDGNVWTKRPGDAALGRQRSKGAPALAAHGGLLHMVHQGDSSNQLWHATFDGTSWSDNKPVPGQLSKSPAALAEFNGLLHMVHLGDSSNHLWHSTFDGDAWAPNIAIPYQLSKAAPALAAFGGMLHMVHWDSSNTIWHSTSDGVLVRYRSAGW